jgi:DNA-3-methyladenine glycosylase II
MADLVLEPRGPFSLAATARFLREFPPADNAGADEQGTVRLAFVLDDWSGAAAVALRQEREDGPVDVEVAGTERLDVVRRQLERVLSLEHDGRAFVAVLDRDPVLRELWERTGRLRPVAFASPYEAACWAVIALRLRQAQAVRVRQRIEAALGEQLVVSGLPLATFPAPDRLRGLGPVDGLPDVKGARLRALADAALDGRLDPYALRALPADEAIARLQELPGLGPFWASLVFVRATGAADAFVPIERLRRAAARAYDLPEPPSDEAFAELAERWRPFRGWAGVLLRAGDRSR